MKRPVKGFTLIELLVAVSLLSLMSAAIFSVFSRGIALEKRSKEAGIYEKDAWIAADGLAREFRNGTVFPGIAFEGRSTTISFLTVLHSGASAGAAGPELGLVQYVYDPQSRSLFRQERPYFELFKDKNDTVSPPAPRPVLTDVDRFSIRYYSFNKSIMKLEWTDVWDSKDAFPMGIRIEIALGAAHKGKQVIKTVYVPSPR